MDSLHDTQGGITFELLNHPLNEVFQAVVKFIQTNPLKPTMF